MMSMPALQASAYLHHLHFSSPDPARLSSFYESAMDTISERQPDGRFLNRGPSRRLIFSQGVAKKLVHAGFAVRDAQALAGLRSFAETSELSPKPFEVPLFRAGAFSVVDPDDNVIVFGLAAAEQAVVGHRIRGPIQHLTLATRNVEAIEDFYAGKLGFGVSDRVVHEDGRVMTCFMRGNHEHHNLACFYQDRAGVDHHSYEAGEWDTIRDWSDHFAEHDLQLMWGPGRHGPGDNLFIFVKDPDENWIEVSAELEVVHDRPVKQWPHAPRTLNLWGNAIMRA
jgi:catechol 2,3-dioxygenase-like lactoylglutathione lyase family enzyme